MPRGTGRGDSTPRATLPARSRQARSGFLLLLRSAPWTRAVFLLRGSPGVVLALVVATAILGVAAASGPLFLSSVGSAALGGQIASGCSERALPTVSNPAVNDDPVMDFYPPQTGAQVEQGDRLVRATMTGLGLPAPYRVLLHSARLQPGTDPVNGTVTLFSRPDALQHVDVLSSAGEPGVWITDRYAGVRGLVAGDTLRFVSGSARIAGIYRDLAGNRFGSALPGYWCSWADYIVPTLERRPPPFVLVDPATLFGLVPVLAQRAADDPEIQAWWYSPTDAARASLAEARQVDDAISALAQRVRDTAASLRLSGGGYERADSLTTYVAAAQRARDSVVGPVLPISVTATLVALLLLAGAGGLWVEQRSREVALLRSRGVAVGPIGVKALLEMLLPVLVGAALGWSLAAALVRLLGPSALLEPGAVVTAARTVGLAAAAGLVALGSIAAIGSVRRVDRRPRRRWRVSMVPWELTVLAAAVWVYRRAVEQGGVAAYGQSVTLNPLLIAFPLLALVGGLLLLARVLSLLLPLLRRVSGGWPTAGWLTVRRLVGSAAITLGVFVLAAVPLGVLAYSDGLTGSLLQTVAAKAGTYNGSEASLDLRAYAGREPTPDLHGDGTFVNVVRAGRANDATIALLGIEPDLFGSFASWNDAAVGGTRAQLLGALAGADHTGAVPAILVGAPENTTVDAVRLFRTDIPVRVVASARTFPGQRAPGEPMLVVDRTDLHDRDRYADRQIEVWTDDSHLSAVLSQFNDQGVQVERRRTPDSFFGAVDLLPITWTFGYLEVIAALTGLIAATALLLYLAARQRQRVSAFHLGRRMGITDASHLRSLLLEVAAVLVGAWLAGSTLGLLCVELAYRLLDLNPTFPPQPLFDLPVGLLGRSVLAVAVATVLIGGLAHAAARRTEAGSVLRVD